MVIDGKAKFRQQRRQNERQTFRRDQYLVEGILERARKGEFDRRFDKGVRP